VPSSFDHHDKAAMKNTFVLFSADLYSVFTRVTVGCTTWYRMVQYKISLELREESAYLE
jgi:hypothetical protein